MKEYFGQNPWMGLISYSEPVDGENNYLFCGRTHETSELTSLIDNNIFVTMYGMSGVGKTSLINAGIFPQVRKMNYMPVILRLGLAQDDDSFQDLIIDSLKSVIEGSNGNIEQNHTLISSLPDKDSEDYLWAFFAQNSFYDSNHSVVFPLFVFDQFEELFRKQSLKNKLVVLLKQIYYLLDDAHSINEADYEYDYNYRFLVSIREDDLYKMEEIIDDEFLIPLRNVRFRLKPMTKEGATEVILKPGGYFFNESERQSIASSIIESSTDKWDNICSNLISLTCSRLFEAFKNNKKAIGLVEVKDFITNDMFAILYGEATANLTDDEKIYIEQHLIDSSGRRDSVSENDFIQNVPNGMALLEEGPNKIMQRVSISSDSERMRIELLHDSFCQAIISQKEGRSKVQSIFSVYVTIILWFIIIAILIAIAYALINFIWMK